MKPKQRVMTILILLLLAFVIKNHEALSNKIVKANYIGIQKVKIRQAPNVKKTDITIDEFVKQMTSLVKNELNEQAKIDEEAKKIVFDGLTLNELAAKLERSLNSSLSGKGYLFAEYSINLGLNPYLALAITLEETGCRWECSQLVKQCNNIGGQKGGPGCWGGEYKSYPSLDEGIKGYLDNLYYNYYAKGLTTPEAINPIYAENTSWSSNVNYYISYIKSN